MKRKGIDFSRMEKRFCLPTTSVPNLLLNLNFLGLEECSFSSDHVTQTIYWIDDKHFWSLGTSLKSRRYLPAYSKKVFLSEISSKACRFEIKREISESGKRQKEKYEFPDLDHVAAFLKLKFWNVRPYLLVEYTRRHFMLPNCDKRLRITIDTDVRFWFFRESEDEAIALHGCDNGIARLEIKMDNHLENSEIVQDLMERLVPLGIQPTGSKKKDGLNALKFLADENIHGTEMDELLEKELEAKLTVCLPVGMNQQKFFHQLWKFITSIWRPDPLLCAIQTTSSINHYWAKLEDGQRREGLKILLRELTVKPVFKSDAVIINQPLGILERTEIKGKKFYLSSLTLDQYVDTLVEGELEYAGMITRSRKIFWVYNHDYGRRYHICLDKCCAPGKSPLLQVEIEYEGTRLGMQRWSENYHGQIREEIIDDISFLAAKIKDHFADIGIILTPGVEKFKWLVG